MKIMSKILLIFTVLVMSVVIMPNSVVKAEDKVDPLTILEGNVSPDFNQTAPATAGMTQVVNRLLGFLQIASALIAVIMIAVTGFRYIIETPEMKNELKKSMIPIIVGILLVFFATSIARFFIGMFSNGNG